QALAQQVHLVVVVGRPTLSRPVSRLIAGAPALFVAAHGARWREAPRHAERVLARVPEEWLQAEELAAADEPDGASWLDQWREAAADVAPRTDRWDPHSVAAAVIASVPAGALMLL